MEYRAVNGRCAVNLGTLRLPISQEAALEALLSRGFKVVDVDLVAIARSCIGVSRHQRGAAPTLAPAVMDCSSFTKWLYGLRGIWLPRRPIQQRELGIEVPLSEAAAGDLIFTSGYRDYFMDDPRDGVGHVGIATCEGTVVQSASGLGVIETPLDDFTADGKFRGIRRYIPRGAEVLTLETPATRFVESADDIRWIILKTLPRM